MEINRETPVIAFDGKRRVAKGPLDEVARAVVEAIDHENRQSVLVFHSETSRPIDLDLRGDTDSVLARLPESTTAATRPKGPGRPRLGVVSKEVTLLPRHWRWLGEQSGGASPTLRKLVEQAMRSSRPADRLRLAREACDRFMIAMAGDEPGYEEAARALYRGHREGFEAQARAWPKDVCDHALALAASAFPEPDEEG